MQMQTMLIYCWIMRFDFLILRSIIPEFIHFQNRTSMGNSVFCRHFAELMLSQNTIFKVVFDWYDFVRVLQSNLEHLYFENRGIHLPVYILRKIV